MFASLRTAIHLRILHRGAFFGAYFADFCAEGTKSLMKGRARKQEESSGPADLGAGSEESQVLILRRLLLVETVLDGSKANAMALKALRGASFQFLSSGGSHIPLFSLAEATPRRGILRKEWTKL